MALEESREMIEHKMLVRYPIGTHLSDAASGGNSPLAREDGTNDLATHVTLHPLEEELEPVVQEVIQYGPYPDAGWGSDEERDDLVAFAVVVAVFLAPHAKRLWEARVLPAARAAWERRRARRTARRLGVAEEAPAMIEPAEPADPPTALGVALETYRADMSSTEARERFAAAVAARLFSDGQLRLLLDARIEDEADFLAPGADTVTPRQVGDRIAAMLAADPALLDGALFEVEGLLAAGHAADENALPAVEAKD